MNKYKTHARKAAKRRKIARMCSDKVRYETESEAYQKGQESYRCPHCHGWHRSGKFAELVSVCRNKNGKGKR